MPYLTTEDGDRFRITEAAMQDGSDHGVHFEINGDASWLTAAEARRIATLLSTAANTAETSPRRAADRTVVAIRRR